MLANDKKIKNPNISVAVVRNIDEASAGSRCMAFKNTGINKPKNPDTRKLPIIAIQIIIPK